MSSSSFAAYFSHSWNHRDLPINLMLWHHVAKACHLVIDQPQPTTEEERPYFISRLESIMRHADLLICCMPALPQEKQTAKRKNAVGDWRYNMCSPYILFEMRLAERLDLPRFVLVDRASRFQKPAFQQPHVRYIERDFGELNALLKAGKQDEQIVNALDDWMRWVTKNRASSPWAPPSRTACLLAEEGEQAELFPVIREAIDNGGFEPPELLTKLFHTDAELYQVLRSIGLLVVDIRQPALLPLYHAAHSLMVPTIRIDSEPSATKLGEDLGLPSILQGHPAGYQKDVLQIGDDSQLEKLALRVHDRTLATAQAAKPVIGEKLGSQLLHERTYLKKHFVFISHDEKPNDRELVNHIVEQLKSRGVTCWEYSVENRSGEIWRKNLDSALSRMTHMVALLSPDYEQSPGCTEEWKHAISHSLPLFPFLTRGRTRPNVDLRGAHIAHSPLHQRHSPEVRAAVVVETVVDALRKG